MIPSVDDTYALKSIDSAPVKSFPKTQYIRSKPLLKLVAAMSCQRCGFHLAQAAHSNWNGGKGRGIKASDNYIAALCQSCHTEIDSGHLMTKAEMSELLELIFAFGAEHNVKFEDQYAET